MSDLSFAKLAVSRGFISPDQLREALGIKKKVEEAGLREDLGAILMKKGWIQPDQLAEIHAGLDQGIKEFIQGYDILTTVGRGGMGTVYKARRQSDDKIVAVKTLLPNFAREKDAVERFMREARALKKLHHPNIVQAIDAGYQNGIYYCVMEFADGETLAQIIKKRGRLPWQDAIKVVKAITFALDHVSRYGIVHRDIKPDNIIISPTGNVKLTDLGLAKMVEGAKDATLTQSGFVLGTPAFMSPEQVQGSRAIDIRSDIYSLGITFYTALAGQPPFRDANALVVLQMRLKQDVPFGTLRDAGIPEEVISIGRKMTMRDPGRRYATPNELIEALMVLEAGEKKTSTQPGDVPGGLFGRIAVLNKFVTSEQLDRCIGVQEELLERGVKRPIGEIMLDEELITRRQLRKILSLQSFYDRRNEERKFADVVVKSGFAKPGEVKEALARQKDIFLMEGHAPTLDQVLQQKGVINEQQRKAILRMRRRLDSKDSGIRNTLIGVKECSRCLEVIPLLATQCPRCDHLMQRTNVEFKCRGCGRLQTEPGEYCLFCGANPVTGQRPGSGKIKTCPQCGKYAAFYQLRCPGCKSPLPGSFFRNILRMGRRGIKFVRSHAVAILMLMLVLAGGYFLVTQLTPAGRFWAELFQGEPARVKYTVHDFLGAIKHRDYVGSLKYMDESARSPEEAETRAWRATAKIFAIPDRGYVLTEYSLTQVNLSTDEARAYVEAQFVPAERPSADPQVRNATILLKRREQDWVVVP